ncbi:MAG: SPASM domain-containing protein [Candidatus Wallbacteria bacterium]|nr:SPASM domain-containing protein [Candidatus Wallbacteria bacterium]
MTEKIPSLYRELELQIGFTDFCDLNCRMCVQSFDRFGVYGKEELKLATLHQGKKGFISEKLLSKIVDDLEKSQLDFRFILLHWLGESLLHPEFPLFLKALSKIRFSGEFMLFTNALQLSEKTGKEIRNIFTESGHKMILVFSLDAFSPKTFSLIKGAADFNVILHNIKNFITKFDLPNFRYIFRFLVLRENFREAEKFLEFWKHFVSGELGSTDLAVSFNEEKPRDIGNKFIINFRRAAAIMQEEMELLHKETVVRLGLVQNQPGRITDFGDLISGETVRPPCPAPFRTPVIHWDGRVTACCADSELELCHGNLEKSTFSDIFLSDQAGLLRKAHLFNRKLPPRCERCGNLMGKGLSWSQITELKSFYSESQP